MRAFQCGGVDYVTKPFQVDEVQARVETHLKIHQLQKQLQLHANHLEDLVAIPHPRIGREPGAIKSAGPRQERFLETDSS